MNTLGAATECKVIQDEPAGDGFGAAALSVTPSFRFKPGTLNGQPFASSVTIPLKFALQAGGVTTNPDWLKKPNGDDLNAVWPSKALKRGDSGVGVVNCLVTTRGLATDCKVETETPIGDGYGAATLLLTPSFLFKPATVDGHPVESRVTIPINFKLDGPSNAPSLTYHIVQWAPWLEAPTQQDIDTAFPTRAVGAGDGHVVLRCGFKADGRLKDCDVFTEQPKGHDFGRAALKLADKFRLKLADTSIKELHDTQVNLPIHFFEPGRGDASTRYISEPDWLTALKPGSAPFPPQAAKAGIARGTALVDCSIPASGELSDCQAVAEQPAGLGFGAQGVRTAQSLSVNLWTREGLPAVGAHIKVPITLVEENAAPG